MQVTLENYTGRNTDARAVIIGNLCLYFSYKTLVGFKNVDGEMVVSANDWGPTTGRHINAIPTGEDKSSRLPRAEFLSELSKVLQRLGV